MGVDAIDPTGVRYGTPCIFPETPDEGEEFAKNSKRIVRNTSTVTMDTIIKISPLDGKKVEVLARNFSRLNEDWKQEVNRAIDWFRQGFKNQNILDQFFCYWNATELLAGYWYKQKKGEIKERINQKIVDYWKQKKKYYKDNCFVIPGGSIRKFVESSHNKIANPVREKIKFAFHSCFSEEEAQKNFDACFKKCPDCKQSLKDFRDDIAHAKVFASDKKVISKVRVKVPIIKEIAQNFIYNTIKSELTWNL